jgi:predicted RND superfamily exporter protein
METASANQSNMNASDLVRELARITNYEGSAYYEIPADPARYGKETQDELGQIISNYLVLVGSDADGGYSNNAFEPTAIRSAIQIKSQWQRDTQAVVDAVNEYVSANFPDNVKVVVGGSAQVQGEITGLVMNSQIISIVISILMVFIIIGLANRSIIAGIFAAVPLAIAILFNFGIMGLLGITLNMGTALIASLAVGIGIDYTIHFMEFFKTEYRAGGDYLRRTFTGSGKAILINALSVGLGFGALAFSQFRMMAQFGGLIALSMIVTALVSLTLMPALITLVKPKFIYGKSSASR